MAYMFNVSRYFSTVSLLLIIVAAGVLGPMYRYLSLRQMQELAESRNVEMARIVGNSLREPLDAVIHGALTRDPAHPGAVTETGALLAEARALMHDTAVVKLKVYDRSGRTVFSTDPSQIGQSAFDNPGFRAAVAGQVISELTHRNEIDAFEGQRTDLDLLSSYVPLDGREPGIDGVLELYQDVTPFVMQMERSRWLLTLGVFAVLGALYLAQYVVVRRAQRILDDQEGRLKAVRDTLEIQVAARTAELKRTNQQLVNEVNERRLTQNKLNYLAYHDPLTGLANRRRFIERLERSLGEAPRGKGRLAVLYIDLDQFKQVNDSFGHGVGDELLVAVSARLSEHLRLIDMLARLGGDEFICLMEGVRSEDEVALVADEILAAFALPFDVADHELHLSASIGICLYPGDGDSVGDLLRNADTAMYRAKAAGRGHFEFYKPEMTQAARQRMRTENLLRRAIERGELALHFQPQIDAASGRLAGAEALLRWNNPELGAVDPSVFVPLAEESGLIVPLGHWVLREACRLFVGWREAGLALARVSVNVSARQIERADFLDTLSAVLNETGMPPSCLTLELTESVVMAVEDAFVRLDRLREAGIELALDDFGTGYSSLAYLKRLPLQELKLDRSFVEGIGQNPGDEAIIRTVMELARHLGFDVVAEGVGNADQAAFLLARGCRRLQGHWVAPPAPAGEFLARWLGHA